MKKYLLLCLALNTIVPAWAQNDTESLKFKLNESGSHY